MTTHDGVVQRTIDLRVYRLTAVKKAAYRVADRCTVALGEPSGHSLSVSFLPRATTPDPTVLDEAIRVFFEELLDQELREQVAEDTASLRTLILAQAFSKVDVIRRD